MVVEMLDSALVFRLSSRLAREERVAAGGGEPSRSPCVGARVGGRCDTQSWTSNETRGLDSKWFVFRDAGFVVMMMVGWGSYGVEGR